MKFDLRSLRVDKLAAEKEAEVALLALTKTPEGPARLRAQQEYDERSIAHEQASARLQRAQVTIDPGAAERTGVRVVREPMTYREGGPFSFFQDIFVARRNEDQGPARARLERHNREMAATTGRSLAQLRALSGESSLGEPFLPPEYVQDELVQAAKVGAPYKSHLRVRPIPEQGIFIKMPKIATSAEVEAQKALGEVVDTDLTSEEVEAPITTIVGRADMARQLFDRSVPSMLDGVMVPGLGEELATKSDLQALSGDGSAPNLTGVENNEETNTAEWSTETIAGFVKALRYCAWYTRSVRHLPATHVFLHPTVWSWVESLEDAQKRPILLPKEFDAADAAVFARDTEVTAGTPVGKIAGLLVVLDENLPAKLGSSKDQFGAVVQRCPDVTWWETPTPLIRVYEDTERVSENVVRIEALQYAALTPRYADCATFLTCPAIAAPTV